MTQEIFNNIITLGIAQQEKLLLSQCEVFQFEVNNETGETVHLSLFGSFDDYLTAKLSSGNKGFVTVPWCEFNVERESITCVSQVNPCFRDFSSLFFEPIFEKMRQVRDGQISAGDGIRFFAEGDYRSVLRDMMPGQQHEFNYFIPTAMDVSNSIDLSDLSDEGRNEIALARILNNIIMPQMEGAMIIEDVRADIVGLDVVQDVSTNVSFYDVPVTGGSENPITHIIDGKLKEGLTCTSVSGIRISTLWDYIIKHGGILDAIRLAHADDEQFTLQTVGLYQLNPFRVEPNILMNMSASKNEFQKDRFMATMFPSVAITSGHYLNMEFPSGKSYVNLYFRK